MSEPRKPRPVVLAIMDGWGLAEPGPANGVARARTPNVDRWTAECPYTTLSASGLDVGLPEGQIGNSEVGHLNIGAGMVVYQTLRALTSRSAMVIFFTNEAFGKAIAHVQQTGGSLHLIGLFGPGGVHSHQDHLHALIELAQRKGLERVYLHLLLDGRDVLPQSAWGFWTIWSRCYNGLAWARLLLSAGATTVWIATSAGNAPGVPMMRWSQV